MNSSFPMLQPFFQHIWPPIWNLGFDNNNQPFASASAEPTNWGGVRRMLMDDDDVVGKMGINKEGKMMTMEAANIVGIT